MRRSHAVGFAFCVWLAACLPAHAVVLRYAPKVGVTTKHKFTAAGRTETTIEALAEPMRMELNGTMQYAEKALSETPESVRVETKLTGGKFTIKLGEQTQSQDVPTGRVVAEMDRRGRMLKTVETDLADRSGVQDFMSGGAGNFSNFTSFSAFPEGDVKAGDSWSDEVKIPASEGGPEMNLNFTARLLELSDYEGRKCAKIRTNFKGPLSFKVPEGEADPGMMDATLQGDLVWYYDYENSVYVSGEGSVGMDMKMAMAGPEMPGMNMTTKMLMNVKLALVK